MNLQVLKNRKSNPAKNLVGRIPVKMDINLPVLLAETEQLFPAYSRESMRRIRRLNENRR